jgi:two-component system, OmpR family, alkaline phosphatase synthesis response regulator PhoP
MTDSTTLSPNLNLNWKKFPPQVLLVDDEDGVLNVLSDIFAGHGYRILFAKEGNAARDLALKHIPDAVVLDLMIPNLNGYEICKALKENRATKDIPIIVISGLNDEDVEFKVLQMGCDDFISKPFKCNVLLARVKNLVVRRMEKNSSGNSKQIKYGGLVLDVAYQQASVDGKPIDLTVIEFRLMYLFIQNIGKVFSRDELIKEAWGGNVTIGHRAVDVHMNRIRVKLGSLTNYLETIHGEGYRIREINL